MLEFIILMNDSFLFLSIVAKTRTKDKYRVVYSDTQRLELEKEFHYSRYITIRRKAELASILGLSERQVGSIEIENINSGKSDLPDF